MILSLSQALARAGEQAAASASAGEDETLARLQLDEIKAAISNSEQELNKLNRFVSVVCDISEQYSKGYRCMLLFTYIHTYIIYLFTQVGI